MFLQRSWKTGCSTRPLATVTRSCLSNLGSMRRLKTRLGGKHEENPNETVSLCLFPCRAVWIPKISPTKKMFKRRQQNQVLSWYLSSFFFLKKALYLALGSDKLWQTCGNGLRARSESKCTATSATGSKKQTNSLLLFPRMIFKQICYGYKDICIQMNTS